MQRSTIITLAAGCAALSVLPACSDGEGQATKQKQEAPAVRVFKLRKQTVTNYNDWFGLVKGMQDTDLHPHVSGFILEKCYEDGRAVKKGDVLFRLDDQIFAAQLAQAKANLLAAEASLASAEANRDKSKLDVERYTKLLKDKAVSQKDLDDAEQRLKMAVAAVDAAKAGIEQMRAAVNTAQINLDYTVIRAPYDGIMGAANVSEGDLVSPATSLANISDVENVRVDFSANSDHMIKYFREMAGDEDLLSKKEVSFDLILEDGSTYRHKGRLTAVDSLITGNGLANLRGTVPNPERVLRAGMTVRVHIPVNKREAILVPADAIRTVLSNKFILVVDKKGCPVSIPVTPIATYHPEVTDDYGYTCRREMVAVVGVNRTITERVKEMGYDDVTEAPVVADEDNGLIAQNVSAANSRLAKGEKPATIKTQALSLRPVIPPALAAAAREDKPQPNPNAKPTLPPIPVKVAPLVQQDVASYEDYYGTLRGVEETEIRPKVTGFLQERHFKEGGLVKKGDVLYTIDPAPFRAALDEARANLSAAKAAVAKAEATEKMDAANYERLRRLNEESPGSVADKDVTDAHTQVQTDRADLQKQQAVVAQMEAAVSLAEINLGYTTITAPFDGRMSLDNYSSGALVGVDSTKPLAYISSVSPMRADFCMSGLTALQGLTELSKRSVAEKAQTPLPSLKLYLEDGSPYPADAQVVALDNSLSTSTGTIKVISHVENKDGSLRTGMPVRASAPVNARKGAYLVPARAPLFSNGRNLLVLMAPDNTPVMLPITKLGLVNVKVPNPDGTLVAQPMEIIDADRETAGAIALIRSKSETLEQLILKQAQAADWRELLMRKSEVKDARALAEKLHGGPLPDNAPEEAKVADWDALVLKNGGATTYRELVLKLSGAGDELDLIAKSSGCSSLLEMTLKTLGFTDMKNVPVVVEGSIMAARAYGENAKANGKANKLKPTPFIYVPTKPAVPSITTTPAETEQQTINL